MKNKTAVITAVLCISAVLVMVAGFLLPTAVSALKDHRTLDTVRRLDSEIVSFESQSGLSIIEKINMVKFSGNVLELDAGRYMTPEDAMAQAISELNYLLTFAEQNIFDTDSLENRHCAPCFVIDSSDPSKNAVIWMVEFFEVYTELSVSMYLDDETGKILGISCNSNIYGGYDNFGPELMSKFFDGTDIDTLVRRLEDYWSLDIEPHYTDEYAGNHMADGYVEYIEMVFLLTDGTNSGEMVFEFFYNGFSML